MSSEHSYHATGRRSCSPVEHGGEHHTRSHRIAVAERALSHLKPLVSAKDAESTVGGDWYIPPDLVQIDVDHVDSTTPRTQPARRTDPSSSRVQSPTDPASASLISERRFPDSHSRDSNPVNLSQSLNGYQQAHRHGSASPLAAAAADDELIRVLKMQRDSAIRAAAVFQEATEVLGSTVASQSRHASRHPSPAYSPPLHTHTHEHHRSSGSRIHSPHRPGGIKSSLPTAYLHDHLGAQDVDGKLVAELLSESQQSSDPLPTEIIQHINQLTAQCSALQTSNARLLAEKDHLVEEKEVLVEEKEQLVEEKEQLVEEKEQLVEEKEHLIEEKENLAQEKEVLVEEKEHLIEEKEHLLELKEHLAEEKDSLLTEKHHLVQEKDHLAQQKDHLLSEKDHLLSEKDHLLSEKSHLAQQKDHLAEENSHLRYQIGVGARRTSDLLDRKSVV